MYELDRRFKLADTFFGALPFTLELLVCFLQEPLILFDARLPLCFRVASTVTLGGKTLFQLGELVLSYGGASLCLVSA